MWVKFEHNMRVKHSTHDLSICLSSCLSVCLSVCLPICLSACLCVCLFANMSVCMPNCLPACMPVYLLVCSALHSYPPLSPHRISCPLLLLSNVYLHLPLLKVHPL